MMRRLLRSVLGCFLTLGLLGQSVLPAVAVEMELGLVCCETREGRKRVHGVYGEDQPELKGSGVNKRCVVNVDTSAFRDGDISPHANAYHDFVDDTFARAIQDVSRFQESEAFIAHLATVSQCDQNNPRPECLIERALCSYEKYSQVLFEASAEPLPADTAGDLNQLFGVLKDRNQLYLDEVVRSEEALDTAIAIYSQFFQSYRLHLQFKVLIQRLVKIRNWTGHLKQLVGCLPNKFVGVATTKCN